MVQGKKQLNCKPKFVEVVIGDNVLKYSRIFRAFFLSFGKMKNNKPPLLALAGGGLKLICVSVI